LWVRYRKYLTDALAVTPEFLRSKQGDAGAFLSLLSVSCIDIVL
jgi:aromatic-L-amino-acid/L-tryptophan decarboxylase